MAVKWPTALPAVLDLKVVQSQYCTSAYQESEAAPNLQSRVGYPHPQQRFSPQVPFLAAGEWAKVWVDASWSAQACAAALRVLLRTMEGQPWRARSALCLASSAFLKSARQASEGASWMTFREKTHVTARMINKKCFIVRSQLELQICWAWFDLNIGGQKRQVGDKRLSHQISRIRLQMIDAFASKSKSKENSLPLDFSQSENQCRIILYESCILFVPD